MNLPDWHHKAKSPYDGKRRDHGILRAVELQLNLWRPVHCGRCVQGGAGGGVGGGGGCCLTAGTDKPQDSLHDHRTSSPAPQPPPCEGFVRELLSYLVS